MFSNSTPTLVIKKMICLWSQFLGVLILGIFVSSSGAWASGWEKVLPKTGALFISAHPIEEAGTFKQRGTPQLTLQKTPQGKVVAIHLGYPIKETSVVRVKVDTGKKPEVFDFYPAGEWAFIDNDQKVITAMMRGKDMTVEAISQKGTTSQDTYSLMGFTKVLKELG